VSIVVAWQCSSQDKYVCYKGIGGTFTALPRGAVLACKQYVPGILKSNIASSPPNYGVVWNLKWRDDIPTPLSAPRQLTTLNRSISHIVLCLCPFAFSGFLPSFWWSMVDVYDHFFKFYNACLLSPLNCRLIDFISFFSVQISPTSCKRESNFGWFWIEN
jgi:hypothetical protein